MGFVNSKWEVKTGLKLLKDAIFLDCSVSLLHTFSLDFFCFSKFVWIGLLVVEFVARTVATLILLHIQGFPSKKKRKVFPVLVIFFVPCFS